MLFYTDGGNFIYFFDSNAKFLTKYFLFFFSVNFSCNNNIIVKFNIVVNSSTLIYDGRKIDFSSIDIAVFGHKVRLVLMKILFQKN